MDPRSRREGDRPTGCVATNLRSESDEEGCTHGWLLRSKQTHPSSNQCPVRTQPPPESFWIVIVPFSVACSPWSHLLPGGCRFLVLRGLASRLDDRWLLSRRPTRTSYSNCELGSTWREPAARPYRFEFRMAKARLFSVKDLVAVGGRSSGTTTMLLRRLKSLARMYACFGNLDSFSPRASSARTS